MLWNFITCYFLHGVVPNIFFCYVCSLFRYYKGSNYFTVLLIGYSNHLHVPDFRHGVKELLYLTGVDVLPTADYHVLYPSNNGIITVFIFSCDVSTVKPSIFIYNFAGLFRHFVVAPHYVVTAAADLSRFSLLNRFSSFHVHDLNFTVLHLPSNRGYSKLQWIINAGLGESW